MGCKTNAWARRLFLSVEQSSIFQLCHHCNLSSHQVDCQTKSTSNITRHIKHTYPHAHVEQTNRATKAASQRRQGTTERGKHPQTAVGGGGLSFLSLVMSL